MVNGKNKFLIRIALAALLLLLPVVAISAGRQWITPQRVHSLVREGSGLWLVDVRGESAFAEGHIEGAVHIPADIIATKRLPKGKTIVIVDDALGLRRGGEAADLLIKNGHEKVYLLEGGMAAWEAEGYPVAGKGSGRALRSVMPDELNWAQENRIPLRIFDLRDRDERTQGAVPQALVVEGANLAERMKKVREIMVKSRKKGLAAKLEKPATCILVFPTAVDPRPILERSINELTGDVRYLEGGYAAWVAKPEKRVTNTQGGCPTCPGGIPGGGMK